MKRFRGSYKTVILYDRTLLGRAAKYQWTAFRYVIDFFAPLARAAARRFYDGHICSKTLRMFYK